MELIEFITTYTDDKTILKIVNEDDMKELYKGRSEYLRNDYGEKYPDAYNSKVSSLDNTTEDVLLIYVECCDEIKE